MEPGKVLTLMGGGFTIILSVILGVGTLLRASIDRLDGRIDRQGEYIVKIDKEQFVQINANTKRLAVLEKEMELWLRIQQNQAPQPHQAGEDSYD